MTKDKSARNVKAAAAAEAEAVNKPAQSEARKDAKKQKDKGKDIHAAGGGDKYRKMDRFTDPDEPPEPPPLEPEPEPEPEPSQLWVEKFSAEKNRAYFKRDSDGKVQWTRPEGPDVIIKSYAEVKAAKRAAESSGRRL